MYIGTVIQHEDLQVVKNGLRLFGIELIDHQHWPTRFGDALVLKVEYPITIQHFLTWYDAYLKLRRAENA